jgi:histidinol phosphatase-like PHP family hydrolase
VPDTWAVRHHAGHDVSIRHDRPPTRAELSAARHRAATPAGSDGVAADVDDPAGGDARRSPAGSRHPWGRDDPSPVARTARYGTGASIPASRLDPLATRHGVSAGAVSWRPVDCHAHSTLSDGELTVQQVVERGELLGVQPTVSDHISRDVGVGPQDERAIEAYLDELERHPVLVGGEFCWHDALWRELPAPTVRRFTHRLGSLHAIVLGDGSVVHSFARRFPAGLTPAAYMDAFIENLERFAVEMPVDILAHPTLLPLSLRTYPVDALWTEALESRAVAALRDARIAFEVSARYRPHERLVRRAADAGVRISLGSDGHGAEQVADVSWPLSLTRALGVRDGELYDPRVHGSRTGHYDRMPARR